MRIEDKILTPLVSQDVEGEETPAKKEGEGEGEEKKEGEGEETKEEEV